MCFSCDKSLKSFSVWVTGYFCHYFSRFLSTMVFLMGLKLWVPAEERVYIFDSIVKLILSKFCNHMSRVSVRKLGKPRQTTLPYKTCNRCSYQTNGYNFFCQVKEVLWLGYFCKDHQKKNKTGSSWKEEYPSAFKSNFLSGILVLNCKIPLSPGMIPSVKHAVYTLKF